MDEITDLIYNNLRNKILSNDKLYNKIGEINANLHKMLTQEENAFIKSLFPELKYNAAIYCIIHDIKRSPQCIECNTPVSMFYGKARGFSKFCSVSCSRKNDISKIKRKETNIKKYGVSNPRQNKEVIEKTKKTSIERYGVPYPAQSSEIKSKISSSLKTTYLDKHSEIIERKNKTFIEKYGTHPNNTHLIKEKKISSTIKKYGVEYTTQLESTKLKSKLTSINRYGVEHFSKTEESKDRLRKRNKNLTLNSNSYFLEKISDLDTSQLTRREIAELTQIPFSTVCVKLRELSIPVKECNQEKVSLVETDIAEYIKSLGISNIILNDRSVLNGKELDILLPDNKLAIEINGVYWHSEKFGKDKNYHLEKTIECGKHGIQLLHIFDTEWTDPLKKEIWSAMIRSRLGMNMKIHGRKCKLQPISNELASEFFKANHLQGYKGGSVKLGLFFDNNLVQAVVLGKPRYNNKYDFELIRAATLKGYTIVGGLSKLLSGIRGSIISYADIRYSTGTGYTAIGMHKAKSSPPNYFYCVNGRLESRLNYQKHKLPNLLEVFDSTKSESHNMVLNGYYKVWDCGNLVFYKD